VEFSSEQSNVEEVSSAAEEVRGTPAWRRLEETLKKVQAPDQHGIPDGAFHETLLSAW
jgi:hypothetical protein